MIARMIAENGAMRLMGKNVTIPDRIYTLIRIEEMCDNDAHAHIRRIRQYVGLLLKSVKLYEPEYPLTDEQIEYIKIASALQDIGKITVPDTVLYKEDKWTPAEFKLYIQHTVKGYEIVDAVPDTENRELINYCKEICMYHHERYDGSGFPYGLCGEEIPFSAQVVSLAEVYDLLTTDHFYRKRSRPAEAFQSIQNGHAGAFSPMLLECMKYVEDEMIAYASFENSRKD